MCKYCNEQPADSIDYEGCCRWESCEAEAEIAHLRDEIEANSPQEALLRWPETV